MIMWNHIQIIWVSAWNIRVLNLTSASNNQQKGFFDEAVNPHYQNGKK